MPTWHTIEELALNEPVLYQLVSLHHRGDVTREEALLLAVFALVEMKTKLFDALLEQKNTCVCGVNRLLAETARKEAEGKADV